MTTISRWRKSSWSSGQDTCVELHGDLAAVRDSKHPDGPVLRANKLGALIAAVKDGRLDR
jgi:hypothetical protein